MTEMTQPTPRRLPRIPFAPDEGWLAVALIAAMAFIMAAPICRMDGAGRPHRAGAGLRAQDVPLRKRRFSRVSFWTTVTAA
jgi:hypothetical protein